MLTTAISCFNLEFSLANFILSMFQPCVQAQFRKPSHRKSRASRLSVSKLEDGETNDDQQNLITDATYDW